MMSVHRCAPWLPLRNYEHLSFSICHFPFVIGGAVFLQ
jgi:hypothetical protein